MYLKEFTMTKRKQFLIEKTLKDVLNEHWNNLTNRIKNELADLGPDARDLPEVVDMVIEDYIIELAEKVEKNPMFYKGGLYLYQTKRYFFNQKAKEFSENGGAGIISTCKVVDIEKWISAIFLLYLEDYLIKKAHNFRIF